LTTWHCILSAEFCDLRFFPLGKVNYEKKKKISKVKFVKRKHKCRQTSFKWSRENKRFLWIPTHIVWAKSNEHWEATRHKRNRV